MLKGKSCNTILHKVFFKYFYRDYRRQPTLQGSPIHHYLVPAHQQPQVAIPAGMSQYAPFSPTVAPPPAHQSPRHIQYTTHPLPAHVHPVLQTSTIPTVQYQPQLTSQYGGLGSLNPTSAGLYATYPLSPNKGRPFQYFACCYFVMFHITCSFHWC